MAWLRRACDANAISHSQRLLELHRRNMRNTRRTATLKQLLSKCESANQGLHLALKLKGGITAEGRACRAHLPRRGRVTPVAVDLRIVMDDSARATLESLSKDLYRMMEAGKWRLAAENLRVEIAEIKGENITIPPEPDQDLVSHARAYLSHSHPPLTFACARQEERLLNEARSERSLRDRAIGWTDEQSHHFDEEISKRFLQVIGGNRAGG
jgi:hypothetical protein